MVVKRINTEEFRDRARYLADTAGFDFLTELGRADQTDDGNPAKVVETLQLIARTARELAVHLDDRGTVHTLREAPDE